MSNGIDLDAMFAEMERAADRAERTLNGRFATTYRELRALTPEQIDDITPDASDQKEYERLLALVQEATDKNLSQAQLIERIRDLGDVAVRIARRVSSIADLV